MVKPDERYTQALPARPAIHLICELIHKGGNKYGGDQYDHERNYNYAGGAVIHGYHPPLAAQNRTPFLPARRPSSKAAFLI
jgi:hypothetical protein